MKKGHYCVNIIKHMQIIWKGHGLGYRSFHQRLQNDFKRRAIEKYVISYSLIANDFILALNF